MALRTWGTVAGNWSDQTKWVQGAVPTSSDDVEFISTSANCIYDTQELACKDINFTGFTGSFTLNGYIPIYGNATFVSGMTITVTGGVYFQFVGSGNVTLTSGGKDLKNVRYQKPAGSKVTLSDNLTASGAVLITTGEIDMNGKTVSMGSFFTSGTEAKTVTLGSASVTLTANGGWDVSNGGGTLTFSGASSSITITGAGRNFNGYGQTYGTVIFSTTAGCNMTGTNTIDTFTVTGTGNTVASVTMSDDITVSTSLAFNGNSGSNGINRLLVFTTPAGTQRTITFNGTAVTGQYVDFIDINGAGTGSWDLSGITGGSGDGGNNSGITFTSFPDAYWIGNGGNWNAKTGSNYDHWATTDGGSAQSQLPLPQTLVHFTSNSFSSASQTVTSSLSVMQPRCFGGCVWTGVTNNPTWNVSGTLNVVNGSQFTLDSGMTFNKTSSAINFTVRSGTMTITSAGKNLFGITITALGATVKLGDDVTANGIASTVSRGTLDLNGKTLKVLTLASAAAAYVRGITFNGGTVEASGTGDVWNVSATNFTLSATNSLIHVTGTTSDVKRFTGAGLTYSDLKIASGASSVLQIMDANTFKDIEVLAPSKLSLTSGTTTTVTSLTMDGTDGNLCYLDAVTAASAATISCATDVTVTYSSIKDSTATGGGTFRAYNSTDATGNTGWNFLSAFMPRICVID